jgi:hypothetical protein
MAKVTSLALDDTAEATVERLKKELGATSNAEVFRRALQLLNTVMSSEDKAAVVKLKEGNTRVVMR